MINKQQWAAATKVIEQIQQAGFEAVVVGGAVRDYYLKKPMHDIDVATSATPVEVKTIFFNTVDIGIEHGTVLVLDAGEPIEVTTYRTEGKYKDHRRPDEVYFVRTLQEDLKRRDFTMNAMALTNEFQIIDYYGGQHDIDAQLIRSVGEADKRFSEDALRMLRAIRFAAQLGFTIEQATFEAIKGQAHTIQNIAIERIDMELSKLFVSPFAAHGIDLLVTSTIALHLPGIWSARRWKQFSASSADEGWAFFAYENKDAESNILARYKCSNKTKQFAHNVIVAAQRLQTNWMAIDAFTFDETIIRTAYACVCAEGVQPMFTLDELFVQKQQLVIQSKAELAVTGHDFLTWSDGKRGAWVKDALQQALEGVLNGDIVNDKQQLKEWFLHDFINQR